MTERRVVVTGMGGVSAFGETWKEISKKFKEGKNAVKAHPALKEFEELNTFLAAPVENFTLPETYTRKKIRSMGRVALFSTRATELALNQAGLIEDPVLTNGRTGIAFGSCTGSSDAVCDFARMMTEHTTRFITATSYVRMMPHTTAVNTAIFFGIRGRVIPTSSACTSGSQAIGYAWEAIRNGYADVMVAGGAEQFCPSEVAAFDTLFATSVKNDTPEVTPSPFDANRDGLVIGEGGGALILEELEHARMRGAHIYAELIGFATNCDATHITQPNAKTIEICMRDALSIAKITPADIGYINAHGTGTKRGDAAEGTATEAVFGSNTPISSLKSYLGHTLGACGALEAWFTIEMMNEGWFAPTINLVNPDPACGNLAHIQGNGMALQTDCVMTNNFAFGGVNTSLIFKRWN